MTDDVRGSCVCGKVRFALRPPLRFFQYCHCTRCQKRTGSAHAANLAVMADQLRFLEGEDLVRRFELESASSWSNAFCSLCGSGLPWLTRNGRAYIVPAGCLDDDPGEAPSRNVHFGSRASWYRAAKDLETFDEEPPRSR